jgi:hypothetical protein
MELRVVPFYGDEIVTFESGGKRWVAMRRICENMGLDWTTQNAKLKDQKQKFSRRDMPTTGADGKGVESGGVGGVVRLDGVKGDVYARPRPT